MAQPPLLKTFKAPPAAKCAQANQAKCNQAKCNLANCSLPKRDPGKAKQANVKAGPDKAA